MCADVRSIRSRFIRSAAATTGALLILGAGFLSNAAPAYAQSEDSAAEETQQARAEDRASEESSSRDSKDSRSDRAPSERAVIHFADMRGSIRDWEADGDRAILIQAANGDWYRAEFFAPCVGLRFSQAVGFVTNSLGNLDEASSILVDGERCWFRSFERTTDPDEARGEGFEVEEVEQP